MTSELKPCPKCNSDRVTCWNVIGGNQIICEDCGLGNKPNTDETEVRKDWNTRAVSDVPELETIGYKDIGPINLMIHGHVTKASIAPNSGGSFDEPIFLRSQAAAVIAAKDAEIDTKRKTNDHLSRMVIEAEAELAQIKAQEPIRYMYCWEIEGELTVWHYSDASNYHPLIDGFEEAPLFAAPVVQPAEIERLRGYVAGLVKWIENEVGAELPFTIDRTALSEKEPSYPTTR